MNHPNILSIEGVAPKLFEFCMVSRWMPNGDILEYITKYPEVNRLELASLTHQQLDFALTGLQLVGVTRGLGYLHNNEVVHGGLKSVRGGASCGSSLLTYHLSQPNILIDAKGSPRLSDFGLCSITKYIESVHRHHLRISA